MAAGPRLRHVGRIPPRAAWRLPAHRHERFHELVAPLAGRLRVTFDDGQRLEAGPGELLFYRRGRGHAEEAVGPEPLETLFVAWEAGRDDRAEGLSTIQRDGRGRVVLLLRWLHGLTADTRAAREERAALLLPLLAEASRAPAPGEGDDPIQAAQAWIEERLHERLTLDGIARAAQLSRFHCVRRFRAELGEPPMRYLRRRRVERAKALIARSAMPLKQIAPLAGFADAQQLSRAFKGVTGQTPGAWRERL